MVVAIKLVIAIALWVSAAAFAGFTGMYFEESKMQRDEGNNKMAVNYTARSISMALSALALAYIGIRLIQG